MDPKKLLIAYLIAILFFSTLSLMPGQTSGAFPGENGKIVFYSNRDGSWQIYSMKADGSDVNRLTFGIKDGEPCWSHDGKKIVFTGWDDLDPEIYVMNADGTERLQLTFNTEFDGEPCWSPDGKKIVFISVNPNRDREVFLMNSDGTGVTQLTFGMRDAEDLAWSPDGEKIVFNSNKDGDQEIYIMDVDGSNIKKLTDNRDDDWNPTWSPDGKRIAFTSDRRGYNEIFTFNPEGSELTQLTFREEDVCPSWSPDGKKIAFIRFDPSKYPLVGWQVFIMNADGKNQFKITDTVACIFQPRGIDWRPNWQPIIEGWHVITLESVSGEGKIIFDGNKHAKFLYKPSGIYDIELELTSGYRFVRWETFGNITVIDPNSETTKCIVRGDGSLRMVQTKTQKKFPFGLIPWKKVDLIVYPEGVGTISSMPEPTFGIPPNFWASHYKQGEEVRFWAKPSNESDWEFVGWEGPEGIVYMSNPFITTIEDQRYIKAIFKRSENEKPVD